MEVLHLGAALEDRLIDFLAREGLKTLMMIGRSNGFPDWLYRGCFPQEAGFARAAATK